MTWRQATPDEIFAYYAGEFQDRLSQLPEHITPAGPKQYAIAFREPHPVKKDDIPDRDFIRRDTRNTNWDREPTSKQFTSMQEVVDFVRWPARNDPLRNTDVGLADPDIPGVSNPTTDAVYYALDNWDRPWVMLVDIDAKDVAKQRAERTLGDRYDDQETLLAHAGVTPGAPEGYPYEFKDIRKAIEYGFQTKRLFEDVFNADETQVVYTGQGVHVDLLDTDLEHSYDAKSREVFNDLLQEKYAIPIDPVVTADRRRVARLPYSLHADVCRVVQPIESQDFDFRTDARPEFLKQEAETA